MLTRRVALRSVMTSLLISDFTVGHMRNAQNECMIGNPRLARTDAERDEHDVYEVWQVTI